MKTSLGKRGDALSERFRSSFALKHAATCRPDRQGFRARMAMSTAGDAIYLFACATCGWRSNFFTPCEDDFVEIEPSDLEGE